MELPEESDPEKEIRLPIEGIFDRQAVIVPALPDSRGGLISPQTLSEDQPQPAQPLLDLPDDTALLRLITGLDGYRKTHLLPYLISIRLSLSDLPSAPPLSLQDKHPETLKYL